MIQMIELTDTTIMCKTTWYVQKKMKKLKEDKKYEEIQQKLIEPSWIPRAEKENYVK